MLRGLTVLLVLIGSLCPGVSPGPLVAAAVVNADDEPAIVPLCTLPARSQTRRSARTHASSTVDEEEPNDTWAEANALSFGTVPPLSDALDVVGTLSAPAPDMITVTEDDGAIPIANGTGAGGNRIIRARAVVGDGPYAASSGDYDFYAVPARAGERITVDVDAQILGSSLDSYLGIYDSAGMLLASNDDAGSGTDSLLSFVAPADDDYFVVVRGFGAGFQRDPFDSSSGAGRGSSGVYEVDIEIGDAAADLFTFALSAGDVIGANVLGSGARLSVRDPDGVEIVTSAQDVTVIYPSNSPLPGGGSAALSWVASVAGVYSIAISDGSGAYTLQLRAFRPALEQRPIGTRQTLYLDFDGAAVDASQFGGSGARVLSPLSSFLSRWGLSGSDESTVIDAVVAQVRHDLERLGVVGANGDFGSAGIAGQFAVDIRNSRDDGPLWGQPEVTRVVIGGTVAELGINTIGVSQSIDVGNFAAAETAVVLLDSLSDPNASNPRSLNYFARAPAHTIIDLIGTAVGRAVSHEAGHLFGNFHTDRANDQPCLMDSGGELGRLIGVGDDQIFGSEDDLAVDFVADVYSPNEGFSGTEDTVNVNAFGLATGAGPAVDSPTPTPTATATESGAAAGTPTPPASASVTQTSTPTMPTRTPTRTITPTPPPPGTCADTPRGGCRIPRQSGLSLRRSAGNSDGNHIKWKWLKGKGEREDWGAPSVSTAYDLCLYDAGGLRMALTVAPGGSCPPGVPCWQATRRGFTFRDRARAQHGMEQISLYASNGRGSAKLSARGGSLPVPALPLFVPVTVQLVSSDGHCWSAAYAKLQGNNLDTILAR